MLISKIKKVFISLKQDYELYKRVKPYLEACDDNLSRSIIKIRINCSSHFLSQYGILLPWIHKSYYRFHKKIIKLIDPIYRIDSLESISGKSIVVFGKGDGYKYTKSVLQRSDWRNNYRCIRDSYDQLKTIKENEILLFTGVYSSLRSEDLYGKIRKEYPNIQILENSFLFGEIRNQYFDVFVPQKEEFVIDCGAFDGKTEEQIYNWGGSNVKKIYAFELDSKNMERCLKYCESKGLSNLVEFINKGVSNKNETIYLNEESQGSCSSRIGHGTIPAKLVKLDDEIKGRVTMIKMDVEGAELDALIGATQMIKLQKPRLAICLYHKLSDIYEIPSFILSIVPEYRFVVRHYSSNEWETVLYAYVP